MTRPYLPIVHGDQHLANGSDPIPGIEDFGGGGAAIHVGSGVPSSGLGADGDLYIRTDGNVSTSIYLKSGGTWSASAILTGGDVTTSLHGLVPVLDNNAGHYLSGTGAWTTPAASSISSFGIFGDGSTGSVTLTQSSAAPAWATKSGSGSSTLFTLSRDVWATTIDFDNSAGNFTVKTNGWRIFATVSITIDSGIVVHMDGLNATGISGGSTATANSIGNQTGGIGAGSNGANGTATQAITTTSSAASGAQFEAGNTLVVQGGAGGAATGGGVGTGVAGGRTNAADTMPRDLVRMLTGAIPGATNPGKFSGGAGGTGGNGSASTGGGGGGGGGVIGIYTPTLINNGTIRANGGNGGQGTAGNNGGGGGGGGGVVLLIYGASGSTLGTVQVNGGTGGALQGTGAAGANGSAGTIYTLVL